MSFSSTSRNSISTVSKSMVSGLFVASCLLSIVSWYTTMAGMELYLSQWFALLASLGVQAALILVAWLIGFSRTGRALLITVYVMTATVSIGFSYVSLYTWFSAKERPALVQRQLYDTLNSASQRTEEQLAGAATEARRHVLALDEMTVAEKVHGHISAAQDADPYLAKVREAVAKEAKGVGGAYKEGTGEGVRYTAFDRYSKLASETQKQLETSLTRLRAYRVQSKRLILRKNSCVPIMKPWTAFLGTIWLKPCTKASWRNRKCPAMRRLSTRRFLDKKTCCWLLLNLCRHPLPDTCFPLDWRLLLTSLSFCLPTLRVRISLDQKSSNGCGLERG